MDEKPRDQSLTELLKLSEELQARSARAEAEAEELAAKCAEITARARRLWNQRND
jgi:phage gp16-like protein